jgi:hypothetical protein
MIYKLETKRKTHLCNGRTEVWKKAWLARLLGEWIRVFEYKDAERGWECVFNWPAWKLYNGE